jgi:hypothetical protein
VCGAAAAEWGGACAPSVSPRMMWRQLNASRREPTAVRKRACSVHRKGGGVAEARGASGRHGEADGKSRAGRRSERAPVRTGCRESRSWCVRIDRRRAWRAGAIEDCGGPCNGAGSSPAWPLTSQWWHQHPIAHAALNTHLIESWRLRAIGVAAASSRRAQLPSWGLSYRGRAGTAACGPSALARMRTVTRTPPAATRPRTACRASTCSIPSARSQASIARHGCVTSLPHHGVAVGQRGRGGGRRVARSTGGGSRCATFP